MKRPDRDAQGQRAPLRVGTPVRRVAYIGLGGLALALGGLSLATSLMWPVKCGRDNPQLRMQIEQLFRAKSGRPSAEEVAGVFVRYEAEEVLWKGGVFYLNPSFRLVRDGPVLWHIRERSPGDTVVELQTWPSDPFLWVFLGSEQEAPLDRWDGTVLDDGYIVAGVGRDIFVYRPRRGAYFRLLRPAEFVH